MGVGTFSMGCKINLKGGEVINGIGEQKKNMLCYLIYLIL